MTKPNPTNPETNFWREVEIMQPSDERGRLGKAAVLTLGFGVNAGYLAKAAVEFWGGHLKKSLQSKGPESRP